MHACNSNEILQNGRFLSSHHKLVKALGEFSRCVTSAATMCYKEELCVEFLHALFILFMLPSQL